ncbi:MAG: thiamine pyrophosphate-dependent dehydrogenase E1 component subunit alpha [Candidatus Omnitrophica bacterium]|nr:thiamine pyrophosphate-dependent dehydrogenase E1 component subunit alpha [Candidatus Omnitrophota bacterium]
MKTLSIELKKRLMRDMLLIRIAEERLAEIYPQGEMRTPTHFSIGQEAVSVGVCAALKKSDAVFASHRCHAAYLAKGGDLGAMVQELFGRAAGSCRGRGGSAHLASGACNMYAAPILGAMIPVSVGAALSFAMDKKKNIAVAFFGDAALEEGVFAESVNFAVVKKLPVLFVCENNFYSTHTHIKYRQPGRPIYRRVRGLGIETVRIDGNDVCAVYDRAKRYSDTMRRDPRPYFMECVTYRYREHVGPLFDFENPYRSKEEVMQWMRKCPIGRLKKSLSAAWPGIRWWYEDCRARLEDEVDAAVRSARLSPWPQQKDLLRDVY